MIDGLNYRRIVYRDKIVNTIASALHCRQTLHRDLYKHKTIIAIEAQLVKILQEANNHLLFPGSNGRMYKMSECIYDMCAFSKLTDSVLDIIRIYPDPNLSSARKLLDELEQRKLFKCLDTFDFQTQQEAKLGENKIIDFFEEQQIDKERYLVKYVELHQGKG
jgi:HD superfamily phosphohydrolase